MDITGMLAVGNGEKCPFCEFIVDDDSLGHMINNHSKEINNILWKEN